MMHHTQVYPEFLHSSVEPVVLGTVNYPWNCLEKDMYREDWRSVVVDNEFNFVRLSW